MMILSHKYKFIFLKTRKTAGTSIEISLSKFCGDDDIITPITPEDEEIRKELGYRGPQNYLVPYRRYSLNDWLHRITRGEKARYYNHIPASRIRRWIGPKIWNSYYKFCFERNPWDKAISRYYFDQARFNLTVPFDQYIRTIDKEMVSNYAIYTINEQLAVDFVGFYENLDEHLETISQQLGLPETLLLPQAKGGYRKDKRPYREVLGEKEKDLIYTICQREVELFGYTF